MFENNYLYQGPAETPALVLTNSMKRILSFILAVFIGGLTAVHAGDYVPTSTWPYLYEEFEDGQVLLRDGTKKDVKLNLHLFHSSIHYIDDGMIKELGPMFVISAKIGDDYFIQAGGSIKRILTSNDNGYVVEGVEIDLARLNETGGAYGSSSTTVSTSAYSSLEGIGGTNSSTNINHMELKNNKDKGKILPLVFKKYIVVGGKCFYATKKNVSEVVSDKKAFNAYLKENKVKWNDPVSLLQIVNYIATETSK